MLCIGKVVKYAASSAAGLCDQLYHIEWEDGVSEWVSREAIQYEGTVSLHGSMALWSMYLHFHLSLTFLMHIGSVECVSFNGYITSCHVLYESVPFTSLRF